MTDTTRDATTVTRPTQVTDETAAAAPSTDRVGAVQAGSEPAGAEQVAAERAAADRAAANQAGADQAAAQPGTAQRAATTTAPAPTTTGAREAALFDAAASKDLQSRW